MARVRRLTQQTLLAFPHGIVLALLAISGLAGVVVLYPSLDRASLINLVLAILALLVLSLIHLILFHRIAVRRLRREADATLADLRRIDELKSEFISTISHELRTPLTSIGGYSRLLLNEDAGPLTATQKEFLEIVQSNVGRLAHLINDLLDLEKLQSGKSQMLKESVDLVPLIREAATSLAVLAGEKNLALDIRLPERVIRMSGDRRRLAQVFLNLLSNAIKYTENGRVSIEIEEKGFVATVLVRDTGIGLSAEEQERIFEKFYRARSGLESGEAGTGLGLAIARGIVDAHGGSISVESRTGEGTCFSVTLPTAEKGQAAVSGGRILVADQDSAFRSSIRKTFEKKGYWVDDVDRAAQALGSLDQGEYDLALIGLNLPDFGPELGAKELLKAIRSGSRSLPVFVMLDEGKNPPSRATLMEMGADQYIGKIQGIGGIVEAVTHYIEENRS